MPISVIQVRLFASHPIAAAEYARILSVEDGIRIAEDREQFQVAVFDRAALTAQADFLLARARFPLMRAIFLSHSHDYNQCMQLLFRGFWGLVPYDRYADELAQAIRHVAAGRLWFPAPVVSRWIRNNNTWQGPVVPSGLTRRECEIAECLQRRLSNKEIAELFSISERTVKFHVTNLFSKLGVGSRNEIASTKSAGAAEN